MVAPERDRSGASNSLTARPAAHGAARAERLLLGQRHADRLRAHRRHRAARLHARRGRLRDQPRRQHGRRHHLFRDRGRRRRRATCSAFRRSRCRSPARRASTSRAPSASRCRWSSASQRAPFGEPVLLNVNVPDIAPAQLRRHGGDAPGQAAQGRAGGQAADAARRDRVLDRPGGRAQPTPGPGTDFHAVEKRRGLGDAAAHGPHPRHPARARRRSGCAA